MFNTGNKHEIKKKVRKSKKVSRLLGLCLYFSHTNKTKYKGRRF